MAVNSLYSPKYTTLEEVKLSLSGKLNFSNDDPQACSDNEALDYIQKGEARIQLILSRQYLVPFKGVNDLQVLIPFHEIEQIETIQYISELCLLQTCIFLLKTFFGKKEGVRGNTFLENYESQLKEQLEYVIGIDPKTKEYLYPPMPGLATNNRASFFRAGIQSPLTCTVGIRSDSLGNRVRRRLPIPDANWQWWVPLNEQKNFNGGP